LIEFNFGFSSPYPSHTIFASILEKCHFNSFMNSLTEGPCGDELRALDLYLEVFHINWKLGKMWVGLFKRFEKLK
jgi:hypothetical protein